MYFSDKDPLFLNYLRFMELFRGKVGRNSGFSSVQSEKKEFTFSVLHSPGCEGLLLKSPIVYTVLIPTIFEFQIPENRKKKGGITFMVIENDSSQSGVPTNYNIQVVSGNNAQIVKDYSLTQCAGFLETPEVYSGWANWLTEANKKNISNTDVNFYVAYVDKVPAGGAITVRLDSCIGIYGVATVPKYRNQGIGAVLLRQILSLATTDIVGLQVETGSYAHQYYKKLGFKNIFELGRFKNEN